MKADTRTAKAAQRRLATLANDEIARHSRRFFKTGKGEYAEGDLFRGIRVPVVRAVARECAQMPLGERLRLLRSPFHEDRLLAVILLSSAYTRGDERERQCIAEAYLRNTRYINNWDLVDTSAAQILGPQFENQPEALRRLARSSNLWERRMAVIATAHYIRCGKCDLTLELVERLLPDRHDLIHKACGWMLREVGARCDKGVLRAFLNEHAPQMSRTMLRYAIEHFTPRERQRYLRLT